MAFPCLFPGGVGCFFEDRPFGEGLKFEKWIWCLIYYYGGKFGADVAFPFVAIYGAPAQVCGEKKMVLKEPR